MSHWFKNSFHILQLYKALEWHASCNFSAIMSGALFVLLFWTNLHTKYRFFCFTLIFIMSGNILFVSLFRDQNDIGLQFPSYPQKSTFILYLHSAISFMMLDVLCMVQFTVCHETEFSGTLMRYPLPLFQKIQNQDYPCLVWRGCKLVIWLISVFQFWHSTPPQFLFHDTPNHLTLFLAPKGMFDVFTRLLCVDLSLCSKVLSPSLMLLVLANYWR